MQPSNNQLNAAGQDLAARLAAYKIQQVHRDSQRTINVAGVGGMVSAAYEQLRNAAEYTQEHLLRQRAIRRFYIRNLSFGSKTNVKPAIANELIIELTQAGYIKNNTQPVEVLAALQSTIKKHYDNYWRLRDANVTSNYAHDLTLDLLSVESDGLIAAKPPQDIFTQFAYQHYLSTLPKESFLETISDAESYEASVYIAVHKALLKSNLSTIRYDMQNLHRLQDHDIHEYVKFFASVDRIFDSSSNDKLTRYINKYGAPLRILKNVIQDSDIDDILPDRNHFLAAYDTYIARAYQEAKIKLNKGAIKSIVFLFITKALIGLMVEIPYDILVTGSIVVVPLVVNLLVPVVYMASLRLSLRLPERTNSDAVRLYADTMLYDQAGYDLYPAFKKPKHNIGFSVVYVLMFIIVFGLVVNLLMKSQFNIIQGAIFFIFLATASFLGFRLSNIIRELELIAAKPSLITTLRDFFYTPFILVGRWLSDKYAKVNIITLILDTLIELPLKTILRLLRQWTDFISQKKDEI